MCVEPEAAPPGLPAEYQAEEVAAQPLELTSADGTRFSGALALSPRPSGTAVVILPDVRGHFAFYEQLAQRFAEAGHHAIVFDYYGRTAGMGPRDGDFEWRTHLVQTTYEQVRSDLLAAVGVLVERTGADRMVAVGFCFGGTNAFLSAELDQLAGVVGFYGNLRPDRMPHPRTRAAHMRVPVLGIFGGADPSITADDIASFDTALADAGVGHELVTYRGAPHSFFDRTADRYAAESEDAWRRVLGWLRTTV